VSVQSIRIRTGAVDAVGHALVGRPEKGRIRVMRLREVCVRQLEQARHYVRLVALMKNLLDFSISATKRCSAVANFSPISEVDLEIGRNRQYSR
jgi:hypothetical protein